MGSTENRKREKYWLKRRKENLDVNMRIRRLALNKPFREFVTIFSHLSKTGNVYTPRGLHRACLSNGVEVSLATVYNYLKSLDSLGLIFCRFDGARTFFSLHLDNETFIRLADMIRAQVFLENYETL
ncbi:MAG: transcriptional repressor [Planctomycetota bacterium]|nr:transcriptional repressor [Planctomycetota bacterium]